MMRHCPRCPSKLLEPARESGMEIDACKSCGGLWFDAGQLAQAMKIHDPELAPSGAVADSLGTKLEESSLGCPSCGCRLDEYTRFNHHTRG